MKSIKMIAMIAVVSIISTGCLSTNVSQPTSPICSVVKANLKADITVGKDIAGESSAMILFGLFKIGGDTKFADGVNYSVGGQQGSPLAALDSVAPVKAAAAYNACTANNADVLVAPRYTVEIEDYFVFKNVKVTVKGKKGTIKSIK